MMKSENMMKETNIISRGNVNILIFCNITINTSFQEQVM